MKKLWKGEKRFYLSALFFLIIASYVLLSNSIGNSKTVSDNQAARVLNKGEAKTIDIQKGATENKEIAKAKIHESYGKLPLYFIANKGQVDKKVKFYEKGSGHTTFFTKEGVYLSLTKESVKESKSQGVKELKDKTSQPLNASELPQSQLVKLSFLNANPNPEIIAINQQEGKVNYFIGNDPKKWRTNIPTYQAVVYKEIYKGIDIKFYGANKQMEYDIIVKPGADPSNIKFSYDGVKELKIADNGDMEIILNNEGSIIQKKPYIYQDLNGKRVEVEGRFKVEGKVPLFTKEGQGEIISATRSSQPEIHNSLLVYSFEVASYNPNHPLIIDPILVYSTYLGGSGTETLGYIGFKIAIDSAGNAYVTGGTSSRDFPTTIGAYDTTCGTCNAYGGVFVTKLNIDGTALVYSTYLGGSRTQASRGIAVDSSGNAYITGSTYSTDFPTTTGAFDTTCGGCSTYGDAFVTKLNADGTALIYSTYLGGSNVDGASGIAIDNSGNVYIIGSTESTDFPTTGGAIDTTFNGGYYDIFVTKLNTDGTALVYSTYLGGGSDDSGMGIAVDSSGNAYIIGKTESTDFPTTIGAYDTTCGGCSTHYDDVFVTKLNTDGTGLVYSTYLGGSSYEYGWGIAVDSSGNAYVTGSTYSTDFPMTVGAYDTVGGYDVFVTKLNTDGTGLVYSTYLGGSGADYGTGIAVDSSGNAYIIGSTYSTDFPMQNSFQESLAGSGTDDAFVTKFNASGTAIVYSTYLGGGSDDRGMGIAVDSSGNAYIIGSTYSTDFSTQNPFQGSNAGSSDAFVAKIGDVSGQYALSVTKAASGTGTVTSSPAGINCGNDCYENYAANTAVTLTATPDSGSTFAGWSGNADCSDGSVTMDANKTCTATFNTTSSTYTLTITKTGSGTGTVTSSPAGINCGTDCSQAYTSGTSVTLTATPDSGSTFGGWSGDTDCSDGSVTMDANKTCTASFNTASNSGNTGSGGSDSGSGGGGSSGGSGGDSGSSGGGCGFISDSGSKNKDNNSLTLSFILMLLLSLLGISLAKRVMRN